MADKNAERLVKHGFIKKSKHALYNYDEKSKYFKMEDGSVKDAHADEEVFEEVNVMPGINPKAEFFSTGYPRPLKRYRLVSEGANQNIEEPYYWMLNHLRQDHAFHHIDKITDIFSSSENSAMFGQSAQRLSRQQEVAGQFLATIGRLTKEFFPMIRELRILDERLEIYNAWGEKKSADVTLKGLYIDFAEGGTKNPSSIYGLSQQVGFTILPDLFFNTHIYKTDDIDKIVDGMKWNPQVKNILKRKLHQYVTWAQRTKDELVNRRNFTLKYLRQHWNIVRMYISWVKPYLRTIKRLHASDKHIDSPDLTAAFDGSMADIELLARKPYGAGYWVVILVTFTYRTQPILQYRQDYNQGPVHVGRMQFDLRCYGWSDDQISAYKRMREEEDLELIGVADSTLKDAMDSFGDEIINYLKEAGEKFGDEPEEEPPKMPKNLGMADPFISLGKGFGELFGALVPVKFEVKKKGVKYDWDKSKKAAGSAEISAFLAYKNFKKAHKMLAP